jgi:hypothetical protein
MESEELRAAQSRHAAAYVAHQQAAKAIAEKSKKGQTPSAEEVQAEADAMQELEAARRLLVDLMGRLAPPPT